MDDVGPKGDDQKDRVYQRRQDAILCDGAVELDGEDAGDRERDETQQIEGNGLRRCCGSGFGVVATVGDGLHQRGPVINRPHQEDGQDAFLKGKPFMTAEVGRHLQIEASGDHVEADELKRGERVENPPHDGDILAFGHVGTPGRKGAGLQGREDVRRGSPG